MKKRILAIAVSLAACVSILGGCDTNNTDKENEETKQIIYEISEDIAALRKTLTLPEGFINSGFTAITDAEADELNGLFDAREKELSESPMSGAKVEERDWSKYTADSAADALGKSEAALYDRLYGVCVKYLNDPTHFVLDDGIGYISSDTARYSDLGLTSEQAYDIFWWFKFNNPQFYFLSGAAYTSDELFIKVYGFVTEADDPAKVTNEMFDKLDSWIAECCDDEITVWDKIASANRKICENTVYSPAVKAGNESAAGGKNQSLYSVLMTDDTVSTGYALTFGAMANAMGINTYTVTGKTHAWNAAMFDDGAYYFVDVCWNDGDNGYNEDFIGAGTTHAAYCDNGKDSHTLEGFTADLAPTISSKNYELSDDSGKIAAPSLRAGGSGSNIVKVEWDAVENAEKYEYSVLNGVIIYSNKYTADNFLYALLPDGVNAASVKVRAIGSENGKTVYSKYSEITISANSYYARPNKPANVTVERTDGIRAGWDSDSSVDGWLFIAHGEDSTLTEVWMNYTLDKNCNGIGWVSSWQPENYTYFSVMSIRITDNAEIYSDPVVVKYNIKDGMTFLTADGAASDSSSSNAPSSGNPGGSNIVTVNYNNGIYTGEMSDGKANGYGTFIWNTGDVYEGEWKDDKQNGTGKFTWASGDVYKGEWKDNRIDGSGKLTWANGDYYEGEWKDGSRTGSGIFVRTTGDIYEGEFKDNKIISGVITKKLTNGVYVYESDVFINEQMSGQSTRTIKYKNGDVSTLSGIAENGEISGTVILDYKWSKGSYFHYEGGFNGSSETGQGVKTTNYTDKTYTVEEGEFKNGKLYNGTYIFYNADNSIRINRSVVNGNNV